VPGDVVLGCALFAELAIHYSVHSDHVLTANSDDEEAAADWVEVVRRLNACF
jgi:hypothetical protein